MQREVSIRQLRTGGIVQNRTLGSTLYMSSLVGRSSYLDSRLHTDAIGRREGSDSRDCFDHDAGGIIAQCHVTRERRTSRFVHACSSGHRSRQCLCCRTFDKVRISQAQYEASCPLIGRVFQRIPSTSSALECAPNRAPPQKPSV